MKILLYGEFSGVHLNLQSGLRKLGYESVLAARGDAWKAIRSNIPLGSNSEGLLGKISRGVTPLLKKNELVNYDVIQFMQAFEYYPHPGFRKWMEYLISNNEQSYLLAGGCDPYFFNNIDSTGLKYHPCPSCLKYDQKNSTCAFASKYYVDWHERMLKKVNGVIPISESYGLLYKDIKKKKSRINMPVDLESVEYRENKVKDKLVFFHGRNRYGFKGTFIIEEAFEIVRKKYPQDIKLILNERMPYDQYLEAINTANVIVDQIFGYGLGMNALISMAKGKVVMTRYDSDLLSPLKPPAINVVPTVNDVVDTITSVLERKNEIQEISAASRKYVEENHDSKKIAQQYLDVWRTVSV